MTQIRVSKQEVRNELWARGVLQWLLRSHQKPIYDKIREVLSSPDPTLNSYVIDCARQFGKSYIMFLIAVEECLRKPKQTIAYIGPLKSQVNEIINGNTFSVIFATCPQALIPKYDGSTLQFSNGSRIRLAGSDNKNYSNLRGGIANLVLLDEAGFINDLEVGVLPTVEPMTKTTGGKVIFASTPPDTLDHDYIQILRDHDESGLISTYTIWDDKSLSEIQLQKIINQCKGQHTTKFKREYECQRIVESSLQVIPELTEEVASKLLIPPKYRTNPLMQYWHKYVVADTGVKDKTAVIFAHYNYHDKKLIVDATLDLQGSDYNTKRLSDMIKATVNELWPDPSYIKNIRYIADCNNQVVINDLNVIYKLPFIGTSKGRLDEMVQKVRDWVYDNRILFCEEASEVLDCARYAIWAKSRDEFGRSAKYGHYDHLAALTYLVRNIDDRTDPVPTLLGIDRNTTYTPPQTQAEAQGINRELMNIFHNPRKGLSFK